MLTRAYILACIRVQQGITWLDRRICDDDAMELFQFPVRRIEKIALNRQDSDGSFQADIFEFKALIKRA